MMIAIAFAAVTLLAVAKWPPAAHRGFHTAMATAVYLDLRRGHYELATDVTPPLRLATAFSELAPTM